MAGSMLGVMMLGAGAALVSAAGTPAELEPLAGSDIVFSSSGSGAENSWQVVDFRVPESAYVTANLNWVSTGASNLNLFLKNSARADIAYANTTTARPERVAKLVAAGNYSLAVKIKAGSTDSTFTLSVDIADVTAPAPSSSVSATSSGSSVGVDWAAANDGFGVTSYEVSAGGVTTSASGTTATLAGVPDGTHIVSVVAIDAGRNRSAATSTTVLVDTTAPSSPAATAATVGSGGIDVAWQPATDLVGVVGYEVSAGGISRTSATSPTTLAKVPDGDHEVTVVALDAAGNRSTPGVTRALVDRTAPTVPANLTASSNGNVVSLSWAPSTDAIGVAGYHVAVADLSTTVPETSASVADAPVGVLPVSVVATDAAGNRSAARTAVVAVFPAPPPSTPGAEFSFTGVGTAGDSTAYEFDVTERSTVTSTLDWTDVVGSAGNLDLGVWSTGSTVADSTSAARPETTSVVLEPGRYSVGVSFAATSGPAAYSVSVDVAPLRSLWSAAFPGDVRPGLIRWGAAIDGNADPARHEGPTAVPLGLRRTFFQWSQRETSMVTTAKGDLTARRVPWVSVKTPGWSAVASGAHDVEIDAMLRKLDALGGPVWLTVHHEPEGGAGINFPDDPGGAAAWRAMQQRFRARMTAVGTKNIAFGSILMSYTWDSTSGRNPADWWVADTFDFAGIDHYIQKESTTSVNTPVFKSVRSFYGTRGVPIAIGEWGNRGTDAAAANEMQGFYNLAVGSATDGAGARILGMAYFDSNLNSPSGGWSLTGEPLNRFRALMGAPTSVLSRQN